MTPARESRPGRATHWTAIALVASCLVLYWAVIVPHAVAEKPADGIAEFDFYRYFLPKFEYGNAGLRDGRLPLWSPYEYAGLPFLASAQAAALYPLRIAAFAIPDTGVAMQVFLAAHHVLLAGLFFAFARGRGVGAVGAAAGALYWSLNATLLSLLYHPNLMASLVWMPLAFLLAGRLDRTRWPVFLVGLALVVALQITAGYPEATLDLGLLLVLHVVLLRITKQTAEPLSRSIPKLAAAFALGAGVAALQVVPLAELSWITERSAAAQEDVAAFALLSPGLLRLDPGTAFLRLWLYLPGFLCLWAPALGRRGALLPAAGLLTCLFFESVGWQLLRAIPPFSMVRHNVLWLPLAQFYVAWLAALGADGVARAGQERRERAAGALAGALALGWAALCLAGLAFGSRLGGTTASDTLGALGGVLLAAAVFVPTAAAGRRALALAALAALGVGQLQGERFAGPMGPLRPPDSEGRTRRLAADAGFEIEGRVLSPLDALYGYEYLDRVPNLLGAELTFVSPRIRLLLDAVLGQDRSFRWPTLFAARGFLDAANVQMLVAPHRTEREAIHAGLVPLARSDRWVLVENHDALGEAWVVYGVRVVDSREAALQRVLERRFDPRREVVLEQAPRHDFPKRARRPARAARVSRPSPESVHVEVDGPRPGILVLADACFPGWEVRVDGEPAGSSCADFLLRGVEVEAGRHVVEFRYRPASVSVGAAISAIALLWCGAILLRTWRRTAEAQPR